MDHPHLPLPVCRLTGPSLPRGALAVLVEATPTGVALCATARPEPGGVIRVELRGRDLGPLRVRHVAPGPAGSFVVGAEFEAPDSPINRFSFDDEFTIRWRGGRGDCDLQLPPAPSRSPPVPEQRTSPRQPPAQCLVCWLSSPTLPGGAHVHVLDLSDGGAGIRLAWPLPPGTRCLLWPPGRRAAPLALTVVRVREGDGWFLAGCAFGRSTAARRPRRGGLEHRPLPGRGGGGPEGG